MSIQVAGVGLSRLTVVAPLRRIDIALPANVSVAELLPGLLEHAGDGLAEDGEAHGGWLLRRAGGSALDPTGTLASQAIRDGEVLHLVPYRTEWPEMDYDDVAEAIADGARKRGKAWTPWATRLFALGAASVVLALGLPVALTAHSAWTWSGATALVVASVLLLIGIALSRAFSDAVAGAVLGSFALPYALVGGALVLAPNDAGLSDLGAGALLLGATTQLLFAVIGYLGVAAHPRVFVAGVMSGVFGVASALLSFTPLTASGVAALAVSAVVGLLAAFPHLALRLGKLPKPTIPRTVADLRRTERVPEAEQVFSAVQRSDEVLTGLFLGAAIVSGACVPLLAMRGGVAGVILAVVVALALLLRARLFLTVHQRLPLLVAGVAELAVCFVVLNASMPASVRAVGVIGGLFALGALVAAAGLVYSRRPPSPYLGRLGDVLDSVLVMSVIPLACGVAGLYSYIRALAEQASG